MSSKCGADCNKCGFKQKCNGCEQTCGKPFGDACIAAEYIKLGGTEKYNEFKNKIIDEFNELKIPGMPKITELFPLPGFYVNLSYPLQNGSQVKLLDDNKIYIGTQVCSEFDDNSGNERCYGLVAGNGFLLVSEYGENGTNPEIVIYKRR